MIDQPGPGHPIAAEGRLARERDHFDRVYREEAGQSLALLESDKRRYRHPPADTIYSREYYYHLLAPFEGATILEIACGDGLDTALLATYGARVCAYDLSPEAVELTRRRVEENGVADRVELEVTGDFDEAFRGRTFDRICGFAALHHLPLNGFGRRLHGRLNPGGVAAFVEPVINSRTLAMVRRLVPIRPAEPTEDELPMDDAAIAALAEPFDRMVRREFECVSRVWRFVRSPKWVHRLHRLDAWLMRIRPLRRFASVVAFGLCRD